MQKKYNTKVVERLICSKESVAESKKDEEAYNLHFQQKMTELSRYWCRRVAPLCEYVVS